MARTILTTLLVFGLACGPDKRPASPPAAENPDAAKALEAARGIRGAALSARIRFLSDDSLEGRFTGSRGHAIAERYVASEFAVFGLEPAGANGSYLLPVPLRGAINDPVHTSLSVSGGAKPDETLALEDDFILSSDMRTKDVDVAAPVVFVGHAVVAPEYGYDDFKGVDVRGKVAVFFFSAPLSDRPDFFPPLAHAVLGGTREKLKALAARGAVGAIGVFRPEDEERLPWERVSKQSRLEAMSWMKGDEPGTSPAGVPLRGIIHWKALERLLSRAKIQGGMAPLLAAAEAGKLTPFDLLNVRVHGRLSSTFRQLTSGNVGGILRGSDPKLAQEYVVYTAHLDHLGIGAPIDGDTIYNGALDNASGSASVLELARAYAALPSRPARSILFLTVTGEERGLLGSDYFMHYPPMPPSAIAADLNTDMIVSLAPLYDVVGLGAEHSTIEQHLRAAAEEMKLTLSPDSEPKQVHFVRSDQYSFVRQGVPALYLEPGMRDAQGQIAANQAKRKQWIATRYHSPKDKWDASYDYEAMAQIVRLNFLVGLSIANAAERPHWNQGDFFLRFPEKD